MPRANRAVIKNYNARSFHAAFKLSVEKRALLSNYFANWPDDFREGLVEEIEDQILGPLIHHQEREPPPNSAHFVSAFESIARKAHILKVALESIAPYFYDDPRISKLGLWRSAELLEQLKKNQNYLPPPTVLDHIRELEQCANAVVNAHKPRKRRGAPDNGRILLTIRQLLDVFDEYGDSSAQHLKGKNLPVEFVQESLEAARAIPTKRDNYEYVQSLIKAAQREYFKSS